MATPEKPSTKKHDGSTFIEMPSALNVLAFATARAKEMRAMESVSGRLWSNNKAMQTLPRHMRRRAASHNIKRLPRRLQAKGKREMAQSGNPASVCKRPSRRHRRRPANLLDEYSRRARHHAWMETHIWHAKRFHMSDLWGYRIPQHPNDKGSRAAYRATSRYCILQDVSFMCCLELKGPRQTLINGLAKICSHETGPTPGAARFTSGVREGTTIIYRRNQYPRSALGPVSFLWRPPSPSGSFKEALASGCSQLWLWVHPACYEDILHELTDVFALRKVGSEKAGVEMGPEITDRETSELANIVTAGADANKEEKPTEGQRKEKGARKTKKPVTEAGGKDQKRLNVDNVRPLLLEADCFSSEEVSLTSLKDRLCRFKLSGPLSHAILLDLLKPADLTGLNTDEVDVNGSARSDSAVQKADSDLLRSDLSHSSHLGCTESGSPELGSTKQSSSTDTDKQRWWEEYYGSPGSRETHNQQRALWDELRALQSAGELADGVVLALTVRDPRIFLPRRKTRVTDDPAGASEFTPEAVKTWPPGVAVSPIWDPDVRQLVKTSKISEQEMNRKRAEHLIPGTQLELGVEESRVPLLLIQQPGFCSRQHTVGGQVSDFSGAETGIPLGWSAGWDVVLPQSWAMAFWLGLVYRGARATGLKEALSMATECNRLPFPSGYPDTPACQALDKANREQLEGKYGRMPPAKRPNYVKLGTVAPFHHPWEQLILDWTSSVQNLSKQVIESEGTVTVTSNPNQVKEECVPNGGEQSDNFSLVTDTDEQLKRTAEVIVLRNKKRLLQLDAATSRIEGIRRRQAPAVKVARTSESQLSVHEQQHRASLLMLPCPLPAGAAWLVPVRLQALQRGVLESFSSICLPTEQDLATVWDCPTHEGPLEPYHKDPNHGRTSQESKDKSNVHPAGLCREVASVRWSASRQVAGYVKQGGYVFCNGRGAGTGFIVLAALENLLKMTKLERATLVLVRHPRTNQYRYATLSIISS